MGSVCERERAWFMRLYAEIIPSFREGIIDRTGAQTMLYFTYILVSSVDLAHYGVSHVKDRVSVDCGTNKGNNLLLGDQMLYFNS